MEIKTATKLVYLVCLVSVTVVPVVVWAATGRPLDGVGGFVAATSGPLGVLTGAMVARGISRDRAQQRGSDE